jgi:hypothetical protein
LANGLTVNMLARQPLRLPIRQTQADFSFRVRFGEGGHLSWWVEAEGIRLEFNVPRELLQLWTQTGKSPEGALEIKQRYMDRLELVGPIADANGSTVFRHMVGEMDPNFRQEIERARSS